MDWTSNANLDSKTSIVLKNASEDDPTLSFYSVADGLNISGSCQNPKCISASYNLQNHIWLKKGYGIHNMAFIKNKNFCPGCKTQMKASSFKNYGYRNAKVTVQGNKLNTYGGYFVKTVEEDYTGNLIMFGSKQKSPSDFSQWHSLYLTVQKK